MQMAVKAVSVERGKENKNDMCLKSFNSWWLVTWYCLKFNFCPLIYIRTLHEACFSIKCLDTDDIMVYRFSLHRTWKAIQLLPQAVLLHYIAKIQTNMHWDLNSLTLSIEPEHVFQYCTCNYSCSEATYTVLLQVYIFVLQCICVSYRKVSYRSQNFQYVSYRETCVSLHP